MLIRRFYGNEYILLILITYDVNTESPEGRKRLRQVAKVCQNYGLRVQNSVFECELDAGLLLFVKDKLLHLINEKTDSLRIYNLGNDRRGKVEHFGAKATFDLKGPLII
jgi:CRISPR-associated protein Cas2